MSLSISQGSAYWASTDSLLSAQLFVREAGRVEHNAFILSKWMGNGNDIDGFYKSILWNRQPRFTWKNYLQWRGDGHIISVAPTRAGKGVGCVIPNLLNYSGSMVVIDPKGENYVKTSDYRRSVLGQQIVCLDPFSVVTDRGDADVINPLETIVPRRFAYEDVYELNPLFDADVARIADALVVRTADEKDPHWNDKAISVLRALITITILGNGFDPSYGENRDLAAVREALLLPAEKFRAELNILSTLECAHELVRKAASEILSMGENELLSVISSVNRHVEFLDTPCVAQILGRETESTFSFSTLNDINRRITVYIVIPPHYFTRYSRLARLWITMAIDTITHRQPQMGSSADSDYPPVLFMLDEMAQLGKMDCIKQAVSLMAGYGMTLWMIIQDLAQLKGLYRDDWQTFLANAKIQQYFGINDPTTAKMISDMLGNSTYSNVVETESTQGSFFIHSQTTDGLNRMDAGRNLFTGDEIRRLNSSIMLMFVQGINPMLAQKIKYYEDELFKARSC